MWQTEFVTLEKFLTCIVIYNTRKNLPNIFLCTVEPRFTDTRLIRTPRYYGHFSLSLGKAHTFFQNSTRLIRTPVNTDNGHFFLPHQLILIGS